MKNSPSKQPPENSSSYFAQEASLIQPGEFAQVATSPDRCSQKPPVSDPPEGGAVPGVSLPCLFRNNSDNPPVKPGGKGRATLTPSQRKNAHAVAANVAHLIETHGLENCAFLTLTFGMEEGVLTFKEAQRRYNNFARRVLGPLFPERIKVLEFQKNGNPHYHLLVVCPGNVRDGFNFEHYDDMVMWAKYLRKHGQPKPTGSLGRNPLLVSLHEKLNSTRAGYGMGRIELVPIRTCGEAVGRYIGGYMSKGAPARTEEHKGARFVSYSQTFERAYKGSFAWVDGGREWRQKLATWATRHGCHSLEELTALFGPKWAYHHREAINAEPVKPQEAPKPPPPAVVPPLAPSGDSRRVYALRRPPSDSRLSRFIPAMQKLHGKAEAAERIKRHADRKNGVKVGQQSFPFQV